MRKRLVLVLVLTAFLQLSWAKEEPVNPLAWDFGVVSAGTILKHSFVFKNETAKNLKINSVHSSCGCTVSKSDKEILAPQESTNINVTFNSKGYNGDVQQFIYVNTDNAEFSPVRFDIKAKVFKR